MTGPPDAQGFAGQGEPEDQKNNWEQTNLNRGIPRRQSFCTPATLTDFGCLFFALLDLREDADDWADYADADEMLSLLQAMVTRRFGRNALREWLDSSGSDGRRADADVNGGHADA